MSKFKFYAQAEIKKAQDKAGKEVMRIGGIASTIDKDSDGEYLDPSGFVLDDFLSVGFINWHHQAKNKPKTIVGEPSLAEIRPDGLYVECDLYPSSPIAQEIYETAQILEKDSKTRRLGFSIEGEVIERGSEDENDPEYSKVLKANITGLAITHMPKNPKTFAEIIKGHIDSEDGGDSVYSDTKKNRGIIKESVDGTKKKKIKNIAETVVKSKWDIVQLGEESMFDTIFDTFPDISIEKAEKVFTLITKIDDDMKKGKINDDKLEKAMEALGLPVDDSNPFIIEKAKGEKDDEDGDDQEVSEEAKKVADKVQEENYGGKKDDKVEKAEEETEEDKPADTVEKSKPAESLEGAARGLALLVNKELKKSKDQSTIEARAIGVLVKSVLDENVILKAQAEEQSALIKAQGETLNETNALIKAMSEKMDSFGGIPDPRKSIVKAAAERFTPAPSGTQPAAGANILSKSRNKNVIADILDKATFAKGFDEEMSKACTAFESTGELSQGSVQFFASQGITITE